MAINQSSQGNLEAKIGALKAGLQSLNVVINELKQGGTSGAEIFKIFGSQISNLVRIEQELTKELEAQKIVFAKNKDQLAVYVKMQDQVQGAVKKTQGTIAGLLKDQIDKTKQATRLDAEKAAAGYNAAKEQEKSEMTLLDTIILRLNRERQENDKLAAAKKEIQDREKAIQKANIKELEQRQIAAFNQEKDRLKKEETEANRTAKAQFDRDLKIIRSKKASAKKRLDEEIAFLKKELDAAKDNAKRRAELEGQIAVAQQKRRDTGFAGGLRRGFAGQGLGRAVGQLTGVGSAVQAIRAVFRGLQKAITDSFKAAVDFEKQLAQLQAVTGVTDSDLKKLENSVLDVAGSTTFTSEQIVELQTELGKLGFSADEIVSATEGIARTAQALGESVGPVAQKVGQILNQYNLTATETEKISDTLVSTINNSALSFEGFGTALQYVGPLAAQAGGTFQETAGAMAILADNGFTASRIGTGLRGILTELSSTGEDLTSVVRRLSDEQLSFSRAIELVGKRNAAQLISLIENVDVLEKSETKYYELGSAIIASSQQTDTFAGNSQLLNSALNKLQITFGNLIKQSGILKLALKIIDEDGYKAAETAELLAGVSAEELGKSVEFAGHRMSALLRVQSLYSERELRDRKFQIANDVIRQTAMKDQVARLEEVKRLLDEGNLSYLEGARLRNERTSLNTEILAAQRKSRQTILDLIDSTRIQLALDKERKAVSDEFKDDLEKRTKLRRDEEMSLRKAVNFQVENEEKRAAISERLNKLREESSELEGEALGLQNAKIEQLEAEEQSYTNLLYSVDELFSFAQKEYEKEFKNLQNNIKERRTQLATDQDLLKLKIKTNKQEISNLAVRIENAELDSDKKRLQEEQNALLEENIGFEKELSGLQKSANDTVQGYLNDVDKILKNQQALWRKAGFSEDSIRILDKATERLRSYRDAVADLAVDFPEAMEIGTRLAQNLQKRFADTLAEGGVMSDVDIAEANKLINDSFEGMSLSPEQLEALREYVFSFLKPGKKTEEDTKREANKLLKILLDNVGDAAEEYNKTALENTKGRLDAELQAIRERYKIEESILKNQLDKNLITESQFRVKQQELKRKQLQEENEINKKIFEAEKKKDLNSVVIDTLEALASNAIQNYEKNDTVTATLQTALGYGAIIAAGAAKADAIRRRKFFPVQFEQGGIVSGPSHSEGGVPFSVQGRGGYEMEGGEFIVNKKASALHRSLLERINSSVKPNTAPMPLQFATGGLIAAQRSNNINVNAQSEESVNYLKAIAHATLSTAQDVKKPVRAVVSSKDLTTNETERRLRERNDRI